MSEKLKVGMRLQDWANAYEPAESLIFKKGYWDQIVFVRDRISGALARGYREFERISESSIGVISTHTSKSVRLPVFRIRLADGTEFTLRYNFHDWKVSVNSPCDVEADFMGLFDENERIPEYNCEGFPNESVYGPYGKNKRQFTIELGDEHDLYMFFRIFAYQVLGKGKRN